MLNMKAIGIEKVANFPFPSPPAATDIHASEAVLTAIGALDPETRLITETGKMMAKIPVSPRHSRTLLAAFEADERGLAEASTSTTCLQYGLAMVAALSVESPFVQSSEGLEDGEKRRLREARNEFRNGSCEPLGIGMLLLAYERGGRAESFCTRLGLHARFMREMSELRRQLVLTVGRLALFGKVSDEISKLPVCGPTAAQQAALRAAVCCGWADRVARRIMQGNVSGATSGGGRRAPYRSSALQDEVFVHPQSSLSQSSPDYIVYAELVEKKRKYMRGITAIEPKWLINCASNMVVLSLPLPDPPPWYDSDKDLVRCWHKAFYGKDSWPLPPVARAVTDAKIAQAVFAIAFMKGKVVSQLKLGTDKLVANPDVMTKAETHGQPHIRGLLRALASRGVSSRATLREAWSRSGEFLKPEVRRWMKPRDAGRPFDRAWADAINSVLTTQRR